VAGQPGDRIVEETLVLPGGGREIFLKAARWLLGGEQPTKTLWEDLR
jgi:hypothetical protein